MVISSGYIPSSSAAICVKTVRIPSPISVTPVNIIAVPPSSISTNVSGLINRCAASYSVPPCSDTAPVFKSCFTKFNSSRGLELTAWDVRLYSLAALYIFSHPASYIRRPRFPCGYPCTLLQGFTIAHTPQYLPGMVTDPSLTRLLNAVQFDQFPNVQSRLSTLIRLQGGL